MAPERTSPDGLKRLALQLQSLSELTESLTYRLLELDERLVAAERSIQGLEDGAVSSLHLSDDTVLRLDDTETRLRRLETMLEAGDAKVGHAVATSYRSDQDVDSSSGSRDRPLPEPELLFRIDDPEPTFLDETAELQDVGAFGDLADERDDDQLDHLDQYEDRLIA